MSRGTEFVLRHLGELEELAEEVLTVKQQPLHLVSRHDHCLTVGGRLGCTYKSSPYNMLCKGTVNVPRSYQPLNFERKQNQIVDLDKKRNQNREAMRALQTKRKASSKESKEWVCFGNTFLKLPQCKTEEMLKEDQKQLDTEIEKLRDELKPKVNRLRDMEGLPDVKGFDLKSLTKEEALAIHR